MEMTPEQIYSQLQKSVIGQDKYLKDLSTAAWIHNIRYQHYLNTNELLARPKQNILCLGPSGSGKTLAIQELGKILELPVLIEDASSLRGAGWKGTNVSSIVEHAVNVTPNINESLFSIVCLDEIDKVFMSNSRSGNNPGFLPLDNLLTFLCGNVVTHTGDNNRTTSLDTSNMLIICLGAFEGLEEIIKKRVMGEKSIGFGAGHKQPPSDLMQSVTEDDLHEYGIPWEFLGRISLITQTRPFSVNDYKNILAESEASPVRQFNSLLYGSLGVHVAISDTAANYLAEEAGKSKIGARKLSREVAEVLHPSIYNLGDCKNIESLLLDHGESGLFVSQVPVIDISMDGQDSIGNLTASDIRMLSSVPFRCAVTRGEICLYAEKIKNSFLRAIMHTPSDFGIPAYYVYAANCLIVSAICQQLSEPEENPTMASLYQSIDAIQTGRVNNGDVNLTKMRREFSKKSAGYTEKSDNTARVARLMVLEYCHAYLQEKEQKKESVCTA